MYWQKRFEQLDSELEHLFQDLDKFDESRLNTPPGPEKWSALQTLEHVYLVEDMTHRYLVKKLGFNPTLKPADFMTAFRRIFLVLYLRTPIPFPAPKPVATDKFPATSDYEELKNRFRSHRKSFKTFLAGIAPETMNAQLYNHLVVGRLDGKGMLLFLQEHFRRHRKQALKAAKQ
ncbi:MAG: DinB family protein [Saprospiraceae bacterium]|nr:DinB family protein [Saprospiraceae bacterium]